MDDDFDLHRFWTSFFFEKRFIERVKERHLNILESLEFTEKKKNSRIMRSIGDQTKSKRRVLSLIIRRNEMSFLTFGKNIRVIKSDVVQNELHRC